MQISHKKTVLEKGDVYHISFQIARCPVCGKELNDGGTISGHVHTEFMNDMCDKRVLFAACTEHFEQARGFLFRKGEYEFPGYYGEWIPTLGLMAVVRRLETPTEYKILF